MDDESDLQKRLGKNAKHVKWTDYLRAGFQPPQERKDYIINQARKRADEEEKEKRAQEYAKKGKPQI